MLFRPQNRPTEVIFLGTGYMGPKNLKSQSDEIEKEASEMGSRIIVESTSGIRGTMPGCVSVNSALRFFDEPCCMT